MATGRLSQAVVEADERRPNRRVVTPRERSRELERIGRAERMDPQELSGSFANSSRRRDDIHVAHQVSKPPEALVKETRRESAFSTDPEQRGLTFDGRRPP